MDRRATQAGLDAVEEPHPASACCPLRHLSGLGELVSGDNDVPDDPVPRAVLASSERCYRFNTAFPRRAAARVGGPTVVRAGRYRGGLFRGESAALIFSSKQAVFGRVQAAVTGACGISIALALQWYLARVVYPNARYDTNPVQLLANIKVKLPIDVTFFLFMPACLFTLWILWRARKELSVVERGVVAYALLYSPRMADLCKAQRGSRFTPTAIVLAPVASVFIGRQVFRSPFPVGIRRGGSRSGLRLRLPGCGPNLLELSIIR